MAYEMAESGVPFLASLATIFKSLLRNFSTRTKLIVRYSFENLSLGSPGLRSTSLKEFGLKGCLVYKNHLWSGRTADSLLPDQFFIVI